jgi:hypothetical protein
LGVLGSGEGLVRAIEAETAQRPAEDVVGAITEKIGPQLEEIGSHANVLASLTREEDGHTHERVRPSAPSTGYRFSALQRAGLPAS